jgi:hypothetical protein
MKSTWAKVAGVVASVGAVLMFWRKRSDSDGADTAD